MRFFSSLAGLRSDAMGLAIFLSVGVILLSAPNCRAASPELHLDPLKVKGPDACGECHKSSVNAWKKSTHAKTFKALPRSKKAKEIAKKMGIRRIKANSDCLACHFTSAKIKKKIKPIAGISCESCHGAGVNWIKLHSDYGGKGVTKATETPAHKKDRLAKSEAAGMIRPSNTYKVASNCYQCHTVPNEKLVNVGGHPTGSEFELVAWSQGEVRHNVWYSKPNDGASANHKRMMYVIGKALELEYALRGVAKSTTDGAYSAAMIKRAKAALSDLTKIAATAKTAEVATILAVGGSAQLKINNAVGLAAAADKVGVAAHKLASNYDGSSFAAIDAMLPKPEAYKGTVAK